MKKANFMRFIMILLSITLMGGCASNDSEPNQNNNTDEKEKTTNNVSENETGIEYESKNLPAWGISANIPEGWNATVDHETGVVYFNTDHKDYKGIEIAIKHKYCASNLPNNLRNNFDYYFLYDFKYHAEDGNEYLTTDYEPQNINLIKDDSVTVWVDTQQESSSYVNERGDLTASYVEYNTKPEGMDVHEDKKLIAVQENPRITLKQEKKGNMFENFYSTAYYFGFPQSGQSVALTVSGPQAKSMEINEIAKEIAYSVNGQLPIDVMKTPVALNSEITFCGEMLKAPEVLASGYISDDYTSSAFFTKLLNTTVKNDTEYSFKDFYKSTELARIIDNDYLGKTLDYDDNKTKSEPMSGGIVEETTVAGHKALYVSLETETRSTKDSVKEKVKSKNVIIYSDVMLVDLGDNNIAILAVSSPFHVTSSNNQTFEQIFQLAE